MSRPRVRVLYLSHPVGGAVVENCKRARRWLRFFMDHLPGVAINCPWLPMIDVGQQDDNIEHRNRALRDDVEIARRCDGILMCGGRISPGMAEERDGCLEEGGEAFDLTDLGDEPPTSWTPDEHLAEFCSLDIDEVLAAEAS